MTEAAYQSRLIKRLKAMFPGCIVLKNDSQYLQGMLDLTVLYEQKWAMLEVKKDPNAPFQPNQEHYIQQADRMSFATAIHPENEEEVLRALQDAFAS